jgi:DNA gyrase subunit A
VSEQGRATQGVKLIRIDEGDQIAAITQIDDQEDDKLTEAVEEGAEGAISTEVSAEQQDQTGDDTQTATGAAEENKTEE